jgi:3-hydroxymyristoyl/3-hydroxydecanoyl-(acyl carrier protein) dehydratase
MIPFKTMNQFEIQRILPHRYPFLLVDRVTEFVAAKRIAGVKTFTANEPFAPGHFDGAPVVPCSILLEMTTQLGAILVLERPEMAGKIAVILQIPSAKMHAPAQPGDALRAEAEVLRLRENFGELQGKVYRNEELIAEGRMRFAIANASDIVAASAGMERWSPPEPVEGRMQG